MKSIITLALIFFTATLFAQHNSMIYYEKGRVGIGDALRSHIHIQSGMLEVLFTAKSDTLIVPIGRYKFIKVGDKVYRIISSLEEVEQGGFHGLLQSGIDTIHAWSNPIYLPNRTFQMPNYYN